MNLKESKEAYSERLGGEGNREMMESYYNLFFSLSVFDPGCHETYTSTRLAYFCLQSAGVRDPESHLFLLPDCRD